MLDLLVSVYIILFGFIIVYSFKQGRKKKHFYTISFLWIYHLVFSIFYFFYSQSHPSDAMHYWDVAKNSNWGDIIFLNSHGQGKGTHFMYLINYFPANVLDLSFFSGTIIYSLIGFIGFMFIYSILINNIHRIPKLLNIKTFPLVLFLPNLHMWSSAIGKDTLLFFCIAVILFSFQKPKKYLFPFLFALLIAVLIRPHVAFLIVVAIGLAVFFDRRIGYVKKMFVSVVCGIMIIPIFAKLSSKTGFQSIEFGSIVMRMNRQVELLSRDTTGSSLSINDYPLIGKVLTFLYRPLFIDSPNLLGIISSIDNLILLLLSILLFVRSPYKIFKRSPFFLKFSIFYFILGTLVFSMSLGNLGIMLRMKNMLIPSLIIFILIGLSNRRVDHLNPKYKLYK